MLVLVGEDVETGEWASVLVAIAKEEFIPVGAVVGVDVVLT